MTVAPPAPDSPLRLAAEDELRSRRGQLVVFFGATPGIGQTHAMLAAGHRARAQGRDVVVGVLEPHGPHEAPSAGPLEALPPFDLDAALARKPEILLIDDLARPNAAGSRHAKRWQDVEELLGAGIDVYATLNVQNLESLRDVIAQVTGATVRETVPDRVLEEATDVRFVDVLPDDRDEQAEPTSRVDRVRDGGANGSAPGGCAGEPTARDGALVALRGLAMRVAGERLDAVARAYRRQRGIEAVWPNGERLLVCVSASPASARVLRAARRTAAAMRAPWTALYVETLATQRMPAKSRQRLAENLRLAEQLGAQTVTISAQEDAAAEAVRYARLHNVTKIVLGKPTHPRWRDGFRRSFLENVVRASGDIDVYAIRGDEPGAESSPAPKRERPPAAFAPYAAALLAVLASTGVSRAFFWPERTADVVMIYLLGIVVVALRFGYGPSILAAVLSVGLYDFLFVRPYFSFAVSDFQHVVTFAVMFFVAFIISSLSQRIRDHAEAARTREQRTASVYAMSRELAATRATKSLATVAVEHLHDVFDARSAVLFATAEGRLENVASGARSFDPDANELRVADWVWRRNRPAGASTGTSPNAHAMYVPLREARGRIGVLGVMPRDRARFVDPEQRALLDVFAAQISSALARGRLAEEAQQATVQIEAERLRSALLSSVSHDLRTPLAVITGSASALMDRDARLAPEARDELLTTIHEEAERLSRLVRNLLDMTRLAAGALEVAKEWQPLDGIVGAALGRVDALLRDRAVDVAIPPDLPPVPIDAVLIEQVLINLLENAAKHTPPGSPIDVAARAIEEDRVEVTIADRGPGVPPELRERIFEKFFRARGEGQPAGAGLGLAIARGIVEAHGGSIAVDARDGGGAVFRFTLPIEGTPPDVGSGDDA